MLFPESWRDDADQRWACLACVEGLVNPRPLGGDKAAFAGVVNPRPGSPLAATTEEEAQKYASAGECLKQARVSSLRSLCCCLIGMLLNGSSSDPIACYVEERREEPMGWVLSLVPGLVNPRPLEGDKYASAGEQ
jgi:hypothetical protein